LRSRDSLANAKFTGPKAKLRQLAKLIIRFSQLLSFKRKVLRVRVIVLFGAPQLPNCLQQCLYKLAITFEFLGGIITKATTTLFWQLVLNSIS
jgi:hypothetical protein